MVNRHMPEPKPGICTKSGGVGVCNMGKTV